MYAQAQHSRHARAIPPRGPHIDARVALDFVRYANCWEDADVLCAALQPAPGKRLLSIASAGDNCLALLAEGADVVAVDLSPAQLACLELRAAAFRRLEYDDLVEFLGVAGVRDLRSRERRWKLFGAMAADLSDAARAFWERSPRAVAAGVVHAGKLEAYFRKFRRWVLPLIHPRRDVNRLMAAKTLDERRAFWRHAWNNRRWRLLFRLFFGRAAMGRLGRDPEFFRYVEGAVADRFFARARYALTELPTHDNPYLNYIAFGDFRRALPRYLRPESFAAVRAGLSRLQIVRGPVEQAARAHAGDGFDGFNLSDVFEYLDAATAERLYGELLETARSQARLAYWNTLVPRGCPASVADRARPLAELSQELFARDRAFFYCDFHVDQVA